MRPHPTEPQRQRAGQKGMQTASQKCPAEEENKSFPQFPGSRGEERGSRKKDFSSSESLMVLASEGPEGEKSTMVGRHLDRTSLGWPQMASSKQWLC